MQIKDENDTTLLTYEGNITLEQAAKVLEAIGFWQKEEEKPKTKTL